MATYPFKHFETLVRAIRTFNPEAASWLESQTPKIFVVNNPDWFARHGDVDGCMSWAFTPQGHSYWTRIYDRLLAEEWDDIPDIGPCYANGLPIRKPFGVPISNPFGVPVKKGQT